MGLRRKFLLFILISDASICPGLHVSGEDLSSTMANHTVRTEFFLQGLTNTRELQAAVFLFLLLAHLMTVSRNLAIISFDLAGLPPADPYVLLSLESVLLRNLVPDCHCAQDVAQHCHGDQDHQLCSLHCSGLFPHLPGSQSSSSSQPWPTTGTWPSASPPTPTPPS